MYWFDTGISGAPKTMTPSLTVEELAEEGFYEVGVLQAPGVLIGREPDNNGIALRNTAVSRNHGQFAVFAGYWMYRDLGSTNGSWLNGEDIQGKGWRVIRDGDVLQLANSAVRIGTGADASQVVPGLSSIGGRSLLVFKNFEFLDEFSVPEYGRALVIGGSSADLELRGDYAETPSLVVERRGDSICAFQVADILALHRNGEQIRDSVTLQDNDELTVGEYSVVFHEPSSRRSFGRSVQNAGELSELLRSRGWESDESTGRQTEELMERSAMAQHLFGSRAPDEDPDTFIMPEDELTGAKGWSRGSHEEFEMPEGYNFAGLEDRMIFFVGFLMFLGLMVLVVFWMMS